MSMFGMIIMWIFFIAMLFVALDKGEMDKEGKGRTKFWSRFEGK